MEHLFNKVKNLVKEKVKKHTKKAALAVSSMRALSDKSFENKVREHNEQASRGILGAEAQTAHQEWASAGKAEGLQIWRVEKFHIVPWPKEEYGKFYEGDSYIVLKTTKLSDGKFKWDVHFWLGAETSQDEAGTAAYKTVELDDQLGGAPVQHREVQDHESDLFRSYFQPAIQILTGGVATGFKHVKPEEYKPRLLLFRGTKKVVHVRQVDLEASSLNAYDAYVLDAGLTIYQWNGKHALIREKNKAGEIARSLVSERGGRPKVVVIEEGQEDDEFWKILGGKGAIDQNEEAPDESASVRELYILDSSSNFTQKAKGKITKNLFDTNDVFLFDNGYEVFVWIGRKASAAEKKAALPRAQQYLDSHNRPPYLAITREAEGNETASFLEALDH